jgi:uncharacterized protein
VGFRDLEAADRDHVLRLNNDALPAVSRLDLVGLDALLAQCSHAIGACGAGGELVGFCITLRPGASYESLNYRWFSERFDDFEYLDRIVISPEVRGAGIGASMYGELERRIDGSAPWLLCEVNVIPLNDGSLRFHHRLGFAEVGQQDTDGGAKRVSLLAKALRGRGNLSG